MVLSLSAGTPSCTRKSFADVARRSPRPRLYSAEPRSSQWPSTTMAALGKSARMLFRAAALRVRTSLALPLTSLLSYSKNASCTSVLRRCSMVMVGFVGGGGGGGGGLDTLTVAEDVVLPPGPVAVRVYVVESVGKTRRLPEFCTVPISLSIDTLVTLPLTSQR